MWVERVQSKSQFIRASSSASRREEVPVSARLGKELMDLRVLEVSLPTRARSTFYILAAWSGLLLIFFFDGAMILAMCHGPPKKGSCFDRH